ncbi:acyltransferase/acylhydrolase/lysophospholipase domain-containing protein (plasmid) [Rhizobium sp. NXC14]|uniref:patatin-like phospholipase family protein n=1 Tax=Rhizobium sp. NXC14 TaxID=1981173 RepID=UPI000A20B1EC|nr:patatin-like phospholipase family protein [Rhizobium sp. NXC14]ARO32333.1 acyltransferase/acylhydrolase/lysophospholipase domain-containing protein [Rhizobium sp. NXC14]
MNLPHSVYWCPEKTMATESQQEFQIGLAMAGAISAGAYSAGVFDFLVQALEAWEAARNDPNCVQIIPNHRAAIKVITGASAGAITGALGAVALAGGVQPTPADREGNSKQKYKFLLPNLYDAWVVRPQMLSSAGQSDFLNTSDLENGADVISALNSKVLISIKDAALKVKAIADPYPYISSKLDIYLTISNLRGVPYSVNFTGGDYGMMSHGDRIHYRVLGLGNWNSTSAFADTDTGRVLKVKNLLVDGQPSGDWNDYSLGAVASAAFPLGLAAREWSARVDDYTGRNWPLADAGYVKERMTPAWPKGWTGERLFPFTTVDGGLINNEPFEFARYCLMEKPGKPNPRSGEDADRAVIMIDPFPEPPPFPPDGQPGGDLMSVLMALLPALRAQTQFKPSEVAVAATDGIFSRFLICPHRVPPGGLEEPYAIASGLLGGFGGFLARTFREHDYQLGRRNCQKFLKDSFVLYGENKIIISWPAAARDSTVFRGRDIDGRATFQIIPLLGDAAEEVPYPEWPRIDETNFQELQSAIERRIEKLAGALIAQKGPSWLLRRLMEIGLHFGKKRVFTFVRLAILSDLVRRDQLSEWVLPKSWKRPANATDTEVRLVVAALLNPAFDFRNEAGLAKATGLEIGKVREILAACQAETAARFFVWRAPWTDRAGDPVYTLASRKPAAIWRVPGLRQIGNWVTAPAIDPPGI